MTPKDPKVSAGITQNVGAMEQAASKSFHTLHVAFAEFAFSNRAARTQNAGAKAGSSFKAQS